MLSIFVVVLFRFELLLYCLFVAVEPAVSSKLLSNRKRVAAIAWCAPRRLARLSASHGSSSSAALAAALAAALSAAFAFTAAAAPWSLRPAGAVGGEGDRFREGEGEGGEATPVAAPLPPPIVAVTNVGCLPFLFLTLSVVAFSLALGLLLLASALAAAAATTTAATLAACKEVTFVLSLPVSDVDTVPSPKIFNPIKEGPSGGLALGRHR